MIKLKELRKKKGLKQSDLARDLDINIRTIQAYEQGRRVPPISVINKMAEYFNVDIDYLIGKEQEGRVVFGTEKELLELIESLPENKKKAAIEIIKNFMQ